MDFIEKCFKLKENKTTFKTELMAGLTTFMTMAYILVVNPSILSTTGMDAGALLTATCIASALGTFFMAFFANYPFVLAPGMGLNAYFAFTICAQKGYSWHVALARYSSRVLSLLFYPQSMSARQSSMPFPQT